jgi:hypothetical protein
MHGSNRPFSGFKTLDTDTQMRKSSDHLITGSMAPTFDGWSSGRLIGQDTPPLVETLITVSNKQ